MAEHCECADRLARLICRREAVQKRHLAGWQERPAGHYADCLEDLVEGGVLRSTPRTRCRPSAGPAAITTLDVGGPGARRPSDADEVVGVEASGSGGGMCLHRSRERCMRVVPPSSLRWMGRPA